MAMKKTILGRYGNDRGHWVGDGFPVRSLFSYDSLGAHISPFLLLDYAGPHYFSPTTERRGVGQHPHRGFETVTIVYDGEVEHKDSTGNGGVIGPGDVQWMTAAGGILHEEYHSPAFAKAGGPFKMVQLWVNLPAKDKMAPGGYQGITNADIPVVELPGGAGVVRVIAGEFGGASGPARTFTPINLWDLRLSRGADMMLSLPEGHTAMLVVLDGQLSVGGEQEVKEAEMLMLSREGSTVSLYTDGDATILILTGEPIDEPIVGYGPFVMNSEAEIRQAIDDYNSGRLGRAA
jgi:redox-sensitive bicupin YhaK (pirin superfamily)